MGIRETISKIIDTYGEPIIHRRYLETYNDYGELVRGTYVDTEIKAIISGSLNYDYIRRLAGITDALSSTILIKPDIDIQDTDVFVIGGHEVEIREKKVISYKATPVVIAIGI